MSRPGAPATEAAANTAVREQLRGGASTALTLLREHRGLVEVLVLGAILRVAVDLSRGPGIYQDSLVYLALADDAAITFTAIRPSGYSLLIRAVSLGTNNVDWIVAAQHVAGLVVCLLAYVLLVRLGTRRWVATLTTGVLAVDAYAIVLEQTILSETFFTFTMFVSVYLVVATRRRRAQIVASGALLGAACVMRQVGLLAVPVWLIYVFRLPLPRRVVAAGAASVLTPVLLYCTVHALDGRGFSVTEADGWHLYSKIAPTLNCEGATIPEETRPLCSGIRGQPQDFYLFARSSPAQTLFFGTVGNVNVDEQFDKENNDLLRSFAIGVIRAHPLDYASIVLDNFVEYFMPNERSPELSLYGQPGSLMLRFEEWFHLPWWLVTGATLAAVLSTVIRVQPGSRAREVNFLVAMGCALLLASAAAAQFNLRYLVPVSPLLLCAGAMGLEDLLRPGVATRDRTEAAVSAPKGTAPEPAAVLSTASTTPTARPAERGGEPASSVRNKPSLARAVWEQLRARWKAQLRGLRRRKG